MSLGVRERGDGDDVRVLLHGFLGSSRNLASLMRRWCERNPRLRLVAFDLPGHGDSPRLSEQASLETLAFGVLDAAASHGLAAPLSFVGHSLGGRVALKIKALDPARVGQVILLDIAPGPTRQVRSSFDGAVEALMQAPAEAPDRSTLRQSLLDQQVAEPIADWLLLNAGRQGEGVGWRIDRASLRAMSTRAGQEDLWDHVDADCWTIRGGASPFVSDADATRLRSVGCPVDTVADAGHLVHAERLEDLVDCLQRGPSRI